MIDRLIVAAEHADWMQVVLNQGPPCFHVDDDGHFCLRAERWAGHGVGWAPGHVFVSLADLLRVLVDRCTQAEGCDGNCGCVVLSRHEWRESYSTERLQREQLERDLLLAALEADR